MLIDDNRTVALSIDSTVRYSRPSIDVLFESAAHVYRERLLGILEDGRIEGRAEGRVEGERELLLAIGERRFGPPDARIRATPLAIDDPSRLHALAILLLDAASWEDLLTRE